MHSRPVVLVFGTTATLAMFGYLTGGVLPALSSLAFTAGILFPIASMIAGIWPVRSLPPGLRVLTGIVLAFTAALPLYYLRRLLHLPFASAHFAHFAHFAHWAPLAPFSPAAAVDLLLMGVLGLFALRSGACARFIESIKAARLGPIAAILYLWLPLAFLLVWTGCGFAEGGKVQYLGLFPVDSCALAAVAATINASPGLPLNHVAGTGPLSYHWYYFTLPAWLSDFLGGSIPVGAALAWCNYLVGCVFVLALWETAIRFSRGHRARCHATAAVYILLFAPLISQGALMAIEKIHPMGPRNLLILSPLNSILTFGNNTLALAMILLGLLLARHWCHSARGAALLPCLVFLGLMRGLSATLLIPLLAAIGLGIALALLKRSRLLFCLYAGLGFSAMVYLATQPATGVDLRKVAFAFDGGAFLLVAASSLLPLLALAAWGWQQRQRSQRSELAPYCLLLGACIAVPSFFFVANSPTGANDLSMKTGTLAVAALTPMVALGLRQFIQSWSSRPWPAIGCTLLLATASAQSLFYLLQFPLGRLQPQLRRATESVPMDYCKVAEFIRRSTPRNAILCGPLPIPNPSRTQFLLSLSERRPFLIFPPDAEGTPETLRRFRAWEKWKQGGFADGELSQYFAKNADLLLLKTGPLHEVLEPEWTPLFTAGEWSVFASQRRACPAAE